MNQFPFILLLCLVSMTACETLVTDVGPDKLPATESKLVVQSFVSPQASRSTVVVTESVPIFGETDGTLTIIKNAVVKLSDGVQEVTLPYDSLGYSYSIEKSRFKIIAGKTYHLSVSDGKRNVTASCTVPMLTVPTRTYKVDTLYSGNPAMPDTVMTAQMTWQDIPGEINYYRARAILELEYTIMENTNPNAPREQRVRTHFNADWDRTIGRNYIQNDVNLDGTVFSTPLGRFELPKNETFALANGGTYTLKPKNKIISITFEVDHTDEAYYKYHRSIQLRNSENPFSEPALIYSNISGGLGCFAAYNTSHQAIKPGK